MFKAFFAPRSWMLEWHRAKFLIGALIFLASFVTWKQKRNNNEDSETGSGSFN